MSQVRLLQEDARDECLHCKKPIRWAEISKQWYHVQNKMTFCAGMASSKTDATPTAKWHEKNHENSQSSPSSDPDTPDRESELAEVVGAARSATSR